MVSSWLRSSLESELNPYSHAKAPRAGHNAHLGQDPMTPKDPGGALRAGTRPDEGFSGARAPHFLEPALGQAEPRHGEVPLVSVIVPAHDAAAYLGDALDSLRAQTVEQIEILVVDDGSTDATERIARSYAERDSRIRLLRREVPSGRPGCARNVGLRAARGTFVALLDSDDIAVPTRLEVSLRALRTNGASVAFGDFAKFHDRDGPRIGIGHLELQRFVARAAPYLEEASGDVLRCKDDFVAYLLTDIAAVNTQTFFAARADLEAAGYFDESLVGGEDLDLFLRMVERYPVVYVDEVQTLMRVHERSLTAREHDRCVVDAIQVRSAHLGRVRRGMNVVAIRTARAAIAAAWFDLGYRRWLAGKGGAARGAFLASWRAAPRCRAIAGYLKAWIPRPLAEQLLHLKGRGVATT